MVLETNRWYYVVGTYDRNTLKIYVDGILKGTKQIGNVPIGNNDPLYLGYEGPELYNFYLNGSLDEVAIYNYAKTSDQIMQNYLSPGQEMPSSSPTPNSLSTTPTATPTYSSGTNNPNLGNYTILIAAIVGTLVSVFSIALFVNRKKKQSKKAATGHSPNRVNETLENPSIAGSIAEKPQKTPFDVFISYSNHDKNVADALCGTLESRRIRCWIAPRNMPAGADYPTALVRALNMSRILVLVFSNESNKSGQVMREVEKAVRNGMPIIPFRIENVEPTEGMEYLLYTKHWLDAITPPWKNT